MTANQIAAESNAIEREKLAETQRHNQAAEFNEGERNRISEAYNAQSLALESQKIEYNKQLKQLELAITKAQGDERLRLEAQANDIKQKLADIEQFKSNVDAEYKTSMAGYEGLKTDEQVRANKAREALTEKANTIKAHEVDITDREQQGATPLSRAKIVNLAFGKGGLSGLVSSGIYYGTESTMKIVEAAEQRSRNSDSETSDSTKNSKTRSKVRDGGLFKNSWLKFSNYSKGYTN